MRRSIGLLAERYSKWERRAALTPSHVERLVRTGVDCLVQPSTRRIFADSEYERVGARLTDDLSGASAILGVKQPANGSLLADKTYLFFSHVIKAQPENMALLDEVLEKRVRLVDYECVRENGGGSMPRLVAFGEFAGKAGVINGLRGLGCRLLGLGHSTPFLNLGPAHSYLDYADACRAVGAAGQRIAAEGLPTDISPLVVTVAGTGNVSRGACHALSALGEETLKWVTPAELPALSALHGQPGEHQKHVYVCVAGTEHFVRKRDGGGASDGSFDKQHYYTSPHEYEPTFHDTIAPHTSLLVTTMYWEKRFPPLLTLDQLANLPKTKPLLAVADLTCDVGGAVESLVRTTSVDAPFFLFDVDQRRESDNGLDGDGLLMLGVDILPAELPREASSHFGDALLPFVEPLSTPGAQLPIELKAATIAQEGALTEPYAYIAAMRQARERDATQQEHAEPAVASTPLDAAQLQALSGSSVLSLTGHLFDSGLINAALDVIESAGGRFDILEINVRPNPIAAADRLSLRTKSSALIQLTLDGGRSDLEDVLNRLNELSLRMPLAEASVTERKDYCSVYDRTIAVATDSTTQDDTPIVTPTPPAKKPSASPSINVHAPLPGRSLLVLGAGLCAGPAIEMLSRREQDTVHVVSALPGEAQRLCEEALGRRNCVGHTLDVTPGSEGWAQLAQHVRKSDAVLSLLPAQMHASIAAECLRSRTPLVTASYVSPELAALHEEAAAAGVPILCEMGLDPGMDHMSAVSAIAKVHADGGKVVGFRSVCGGLPAPECAYSHGSPFGYKFSWSPAGVLAATRNAAKWREGGAIVQVDAPSLLTSASPLTGGLLGKAFQLEVLPNRDALPYASLYGLYDEAASFSRGTLRYRGWSELMHALASLGLTSPGMQRPSGATTWPQLLDALGVHCEPHVALTASSNGSSMPFTGAETRAVDALRWLGAYDDKTPLTGATVSDAFCDLLAHRLAYSSGERDAIMMEHTLDVSYADGRADESLSVSLIGFGDAEGGPSAMSRSVGLTAAAGVLRLLESPSEELPALAGGVTRPIERSVYKHCLPLLEKEGLRFEEGFA